MELCQMGIYVPKLRHYKTVLRGSNVWIAGDIATVERQPIFIPLPDGESKAEKKAACKVW